MWRVVCVGPGSSGRVRRVRDKGPLHPDRSRALSIADFLRSTGLYESVKVEGSTMTATAVAAPDLSARPGDGAAGFAPATEEAQAPSP